MLSNTRNEHLPPTPTGLAQYCGFGHTDIWGLSPVKGEASFDMVDNAYSARERLFRQITSSSLAIGAISYTIYELGWG